MADELNDLKLSIGAQALICDLKNGCTVSRSSGGAPGILISYNASRSPMTRGGVADATIQELLNLGLAHLFGETPPQPCRLTFKGDAFYERFLKG